MCPLYEVECPEHGRFEVSRRYAEADSIKCVCGKKARIVPSPFAFTFGWTLSEASFKRGHEQELVRRV